jgi:hypothetical protein
LFYLEWRSAIDLYGSKRNQRSNLTKAKLYCAHLWKTNIFQRQILNLLYESKDSLPLVISFLHSQPSLNAKELSMFHYKIFLSNPDDLPIAIRALEYLEKHDQTSFIYDNLQRLRRQNYLEQSKQFESYLRKNVYKGKSDRVAELIVKMNNNELAGAIHLYQEETHGNIDSVSFPFRSLMRILHFGILINRVNFFEAIKEFKKVILDSLPAHQSALEVFSSAQKLSQATSLLSRSFQSIRILFHLTSQ